MVSQMICRLLEELVEEANYSVFYGKKLLFYIQKYAKGFWREDQPTGTLLNIGWRCWGLDCLLEKETLFVYLYFSGLKDIFHLYTHFETNCICPYHSLVEILGSFVLEKRDLSSAKRLRAPLHDTRSELKPVWNLKPLWNVVLFTWQFTWRFHCSSFPNNSKTLLHMCKWYLLINANLINAKQMLRYWLFFKQ